MKRCLKCGCEKLLSEFSVARSTKDGLDRWCRQCKRAAVARWRAADLEHAKELNRLSASAEKAKESARRWKEAHPDKVRAASDRFKQTHPERVRDAVRRWATSHADLKREIQRVSTAKTRTKNPELVRARVYRSMKNRNARDPYFRMRNEIANRLYKGLSKSKSLPNILGYTLDDLRSHLTARFTPGMSWLNLGRGLDQWQIDHVRPVASFDPANYSTPEEMMCECFALSNLQPLWSKDNISKRAIWNGYVWRLGKPIYGVPAISPPVVKPL